MAVAELNSGLNRALEVFVERNLPGAEADGRHFDAVGEFGELRKRLCHFSWRKTGEDPGRSPDMGNRPKDQLSDQ